MTDIEVRLRGYRPSGPPLNLRARVVDAAGAKGAAGSDGRALWLSWLPAAAAAVTAILFYTLSANASARLAASVSPGDSARAAAVADLAARLGGDSLATLEADQSIGRDVVQVAPALVLGDNTQVMK